MVMPMVMVEVDETDGKCAPFPGLHEGEIRNNNAYKLLF